MPNSFTKVTHTSYGGRIKNSIVGVIIGIILFVASFVVLWKNEENGARLSNIEKYIQKNAVEVLSESPDRDNDGKLIVTNGKLITNESLSDENLMVRNALVLKRDVEMYQWVEDKQTERTKNAGGSTTETTTYSYTKKWSGGEIDSNNFHESGHVNPPFTLN